MLALVSRGDQGCAPVELIDDLEDRLLELLRWGVGRQQSPDSQMGVGARWFGNQAIGGFLHAVVKELVRTFGLENESCSKRFLEVAMQLLL